MQELINPVYRLQHGSDEVIRDETCKVVEWEAFAVRFGIVNVASSFFRSCFAVNSRLYSSIVPRSRVVNFS